MRPVLAARARRVLVLSVLLRGDERRRSCARRGRTDVERSAQPRPGRAGYARRAQQLADTGLADYQATAHGYVTFLAQLGEGFPTPPKIVKADELELEVYWHAPNLSKQRIIGRRDTLLLPTDIAYHRDHLGIVQNNFPSVIRIGDGDEVRDVPHPLSPLGVDVYDFALADSFADRRRAPSASTSTRSRCARRTTGSRASSARCTSIRRGAGRAHEPELHARGVPRPSARGAVGRARESARRRAILAAEPTGDRDPPHGHLARLSGARHHPRPLGDRRLQVQHPRQHGPL